jgi:hypothetical protein
VLLQELADQHIQVSDYELVRGSGRWRHDVLPVYQLVPQPIIGERQQIVVCHSDSLR